jgi:hypothetical protein
MIKVNNLKYPPLKDFRTKTGFPDKLVFASKIEIAKSYIDKFVIISTKDTSAKAVMRCYPETIDREGKSVKSLYIWTLDSTKSGLGLGSSLLNFAKNYSKKIGLDGYIHLMASSEISPNKIPHVFYKKMGMNTSDITTNHQLDKFIKNGKNATIDDFDSVVMYYPPIKFQPSNFDKFLAIIKKITK